MSDNKVIPVKAIYDIQDGVALFASDVSALVTRGRCRLGIVLVAAAGGTFSAHVYDGVNSQGNILCQIVGTQYFNSYYDFHYDVRCDEGIYVEVISGAVTYTITYIPES